MSGTTVLAAAGSAAGTNLIENGDFEASLAGWDATYGTLTRVSDGVVGGPGAAKVTQTGTPRDFWLYATPRPVTLTVAGTTYAASASIRSDTPGRTVCVRLREYSADGALLGAQTTCSPATAEWQQLAPLSLTTAGSGGSLAMQIYETGTEAGDSFEVDGVTLTATASEPPADTTAPETTLESGPSDTVAAATASFAFSSSESGSTFSCSLDGAAFAACTSPQSYGGLAGGQHTFRVRATDAAGNDDPSPSTRTWTVDSAASPPPVGTNMLSNGGFEGTLSGWDATNATLTRVAGGVAGGAGAAKVTLSTTPQEFWLYAVPRPVASSPALAKYTAAASVRSDTPGRTVCLRVREYDGDGTRVNEATSCSAATTSWQQLQPLTLTTAASGGSLALQVYAAGAQAGDGFEVDGVSLVYGGVAQPPSDGNLVFNGNFEGGTGGWQATNATLAAAFDGVSGGAGAAKVTLTGELREFWLFASPRPVGTTSAGAAYTATVWVRSDTPGRRVCLRLREYAQAGDLVAFRVSCLTASSSWQRLSPFWTVTAGSGGSIALQVYASALQAGDSFEVDGVTLSPGTAPAPTTSRDPSLLAAGDVSSCTSDGDTLTARLAASLPGTIQTLGDNAYPGGSWSAFLNCFHPTWGQLRSRIRPSIGNHEYDSSATAAPYFQYFGSAAGARGKGWYSYDLGAWHVVVLNSECGRLSGGCSPYSEQGRWLRTDLSRSRARCTLAVYHEPVFSSTEVKDQANGVPFFKVLYDYGADVILNGHAHVYERFAPQNPAGALDPARGIRQFVVGTGGAEVHAWATQAANSEAWHAGSFGLLQLTLRSSSYDWRFRAVEGQSYTDFGTGSCH